MAKSKSDGRSSADTAPARPQRARAKPTAEDRAKLEARRRRLRIAELVQVGAETLQAIDATAGDRRPTRRRDRIAETRAALRIVEELSRRAEPLHRFASFDEAADRLADEFASRWHREIAATFKAAGEEAPEPLIADFIARQRPKLLQEARAQLHELAECPTDRSPDGCLVEIRRARSWFGDSPPLEIRTTREGADALERLTPTRPAAADDLQLVKLCTYLAELPLVARVKLAELCERLPERWPAVTFTHGSIRHAIERGREFGYLFKAEGKRSGAGLTPEGFRFVEALAGE